MKTVILARHAESRFGVAGTCNGDPATCEGLTADGREQARALGRLLADDAVDLCATTEFRRTQETADLALGGRDVPRLVVAELNDIRFGEYEGGLLTAYRRWAHAAAPDDPCPGGGESRGEAAARFARGFRIVLARPERHGLVVCHALPIRYLLSALLERDPTAAVEPVAYAEPHRFSSAQVERGVERLERWAEQPRWAAA